MTNQYTVDINPVPQVPFQQLLIQDVFRLKSPDAPEPHRPAFFWRDGKVYETGFPVVSSPNYIPTQAPPYLHASNAPIVVRTVLEPNPGFFANDVEITLTDIPRVHVYTVSAVSVSGLMKDGDEFPDICAFKTFGDLEAPSGARLLIDTGSSATWMLGETFLEGKVEGGKFVPKRRGERARIGHRLYRPGPGATSKGIGLFRAAYRDGSETVGNVYEDDLYLLSRDNRRVTPAVTVTFGVATLANDKTLRLEADGILGLGYASNFGRSETLSFLQKLNHQYKLDGPFYSLKLRDQAGTITFGRPPSTTEIVWEKVNTSRKQWEVFSSALDVRMQGDKVWQRHAFGNQNIAMIDSGSNLCYVNPKTVKDIYETLGGVKIKGTWLPRYFLHFSSFDADFDCGALQMRTGNVDIYGAVFLRHVDAYFDAHPAEPRIGLVQA